MRQILIILMSLFCFSCSSSAQKETAPHAQSGKKVLVAYFSCTGTTEKMAEAIAGYRLYFTHEIYILNIYITID